MKLKKLFAISLAFIITGVLSPISQNILDNVISIAYAEPEKMIIINDEYNSIFKYTSNGQGEIIITKCDTSVSGNIDIPNSVNTIDSCAFEYCTNLKSVSIGNNVKTIGHWAFACCNSLEKVVIPKSVVEIAHAAFYGCHELKSIEIRNNPTTIELYTFAYCYSLKNITLLSSVETIEESAFYACESLECGENISKFCLSSIKECDNMKYP